MAEARRDRADVDLARPIVILKSALINRCEGNRRWACTVGTLQHLHLSFQLHLGTRKRKSAVGRLEMHVHSDLRSRVTVGQGLV